MASMAANEGRGDGFWPAEDLPGLYETQDTDLAHLLIAEHYSCDGWDWWVVEYDPAGRIAWGFVESPLAPAGEWGHIDLGELSGLRAAAVERDRHWEPLPFCEFRPAAIGWTGPHAPGLPPAAGR